MILSNDYAFFSSSHTNLNAIKERKNPNRKKKLKPCYIVQFGWVLVVQSEGDIDRQSESQWNSPNEIVIYTKRHLHTNKCWWIFSCKCRKSGSILPELRVFPMNFEWILILKEKLKFHAIFLLNCFVNGTQRLEMWKYHEIKILPIATFSADIFSLQFLVDALVQCALHMRHIPWCMCACVHLPQLVARDRECWLFWIER